MVDREPGARGAVARPQLGRRPARVDPFALVVDLSAPVPGTHHGVEIRQPVRPSGGGYRREAGGVEAEEIDAWGAP